MSKKRTWFRLNFLWILVKTEYTVHMQVLNMSKYQLQLLNTKIWINFIFKIVVIVLAKTVQLWYFALSPRTQLTNQSFKELKPNVPLKNLLFTRISSSLVIPVSKRPLRKCCQPKTSWQFYSARHSEPRLRIPFGNCTAKLRSVL